MVGERAMHMQRPKEFIRSRGYLHPAAVEGQPGGTVSSEQRQRLEGLLCSALQPHPAAVKGEPDRLMPSEQRGQFGFDGHIGAGQQ